jgi:hypothetical protein
LELSIEEERSYLNPLRGSGVARREKTQNFRSTLWITHQPHFR